MKRLSGNLLGWPSTIPTNTGDVERMAKDDGVNLSMNVHSSAMSVFQGCIDRPFFMRLPQVLEVIPVSKSTWWAGIRDGKFPKPIKLTKRTSAWRGCDIYALVHHLSGTSVPEA